MSMYTNRLRIVNLSHNRLGENGLLHLLSSLTAMPHLETLLLDSNALGNSGTRALSRTFRSSSSSSSSRLSCCCPHLKVLSLAQNGIGYSGAQELAVAMTTTSTMATTKALHNTTTAAVAAGDRYTTSSTTTTTTTGCFQGYGIEICVCIPTYGMLCTCMPMDIHLLCTL